MPPVPPESLDTDELFAGIVWHQRWELFQGVYTPGRNPVAELAARAGLPLNLAGQRVLDIGAFNCCLSFECERRGAGEVIALDLQPPEVLGFPKLRDAIGSQRVRFVNGSAYHLDPAQLGLFDTVLFFGVLYHLRYPLLALDQIRRITRGALYLETVVIDDRVIEGRKDFQSLQAYHPALRDIPLWQFYKADELAGDFSNWFGPNIRAVLDALESAGFQPRLVARWGDRAAFQATPLDSPSAAFRQSYEGMSDVVQRDVGLDR